MLVRAGYVGRMGPVRRRTNSGGNNLNTFIAGVDIGATALRGSNATFFDVSGNLTTASNNVMRRDYVPITGTTLYGTLIEPSQTNNIRNGTGSGATSGVVGSGGVVPTNWNVTTYQGLTGTITAATRNGISGIDIRFNGTTNTTGTTQIEFETRTQIVAASGQTWTGSLYAMLVAGSYATPTSRFIQMSGRDGVGTLLESNQVACVPTGTMTRFTNTITMANAGTTRVTFDFRFNLATATAYDFTLFIGGCQIEQGATASSYIPTSSSAVTRAPDLVSLTTNLWMPLDQSTHVYRFRTRELPPGSDSRLIQYQVDANNNVIVRYNGSALLVDVVTGGVAQASLNMGALAANTDYQLGWMYQVNNFAASLNGGTAVTDTLGTVPFSSAPTIYFGSDGTGASAFPHWAKEFVAAKPTAISLAGLQALTA